MRSQEKELDTLNIPLRDTLRRVGARCDVTLPLTVKTSPFTMKDFCLAFLFSSSFLLIVFTHRPGLVSLLLPFTAFIGLMASVLLGKVILGGIAGVGRISLTAESIDDSRLEAGIIQWSDLKNATYFASERTSDLWVELQLVDGRVNPHPFRNSLRVRGFPGWRKDRAYVDLKTSEQSEVVLGTILELVRIYRAGSSGPDAAVRHHA